MLKELGQTDTSFGPPLSREPMIVRVRGAAHAVSDWLCGRSLPRLRLRPGLESHKTFGSSTTSPEIIRFAMILNIRGLPLVKRAS